MRKGKGIVSLLLVALIVLGGIGTAGMATAEEKTYNFESPRAASSTNISVNIWIWDIIEETDPVYEMIFTDDGKLSTDYMYAWKLSDEAQKKVKAENAYVSLKPGGEGMLFVLSTKSMEELCKKAVMSLTVTRKKDNAQVAKINCVLDSFYYQPEWKDLKEYEQDVVFTPGKPVTLTLPEGKIASTYDKQEIEYFWERGASASSGAMMIARGPKNSITFTPTADWDETRVAVFAYIKDRPNELWGLNVTYNLKSDGTVPVEPDDPVTPGETGTTTTAPKTGDETPLAMLTALLGLSLLGLAVLLVRRRRSA